MTERQDLERLAREYRKSDPEMRLADATRAVAHRTRRARTVVCRRRPRGAPTSIESHAAASVGLIISPSNSWSSGGAD